MRALPGTPVGGLFPPRLPPAIGEGQPHMAEHKVLAKGSLRQNSLAIANAMAWCTQGLCSALKLFCSRSVAHTFLSLVLGSCHSCGSGSGRAEQAAIATMNPWHKLQNTEERYFLRLPSAHAQVHPCNMESTIHCLIQKGQGRLLPSGHSFLAFNFRIPLSRKEGEDAGRGVRGEVGIP